MASYIKKYDKPLLTKCREIIKADPMITQTALINTLLKWKQTPEGAAIGLPGVDALHTAMLRLRSNTVDPLVIPNLNNSKRRFRSRLPRSEQWSNLDEFDEFDERF